MFFVKHFIIQNKRNMAEEIYERVINTDTAEAIQIKTKRMEMGIIVCLHFV